MQHYSFAFIPPDSGVSFVKGKKDLLNAIIGSYCSRNAVAHITVLEFEIIERRLQDAVAYAKRFCDSVNSFSVTFDRVARLGSALCFMPEAASKAVLSTFARSFSSRFPFEHDRSGVPHLTIGRRLAVDQLYLASRHFASEDPDLVFEVDGLYLRRFNAGRGQYDVIRKFELCAGSESPKSNIVQRTLFN